MPKTLEENKEALRKVREKIALWNHKLESYQLKVRALKLSISILQGREAKLEKKIHKQEIYEGFKDSPLAKPREDIFNINILGRNYV